MKEAKRKYLIFARQDEQQRRRLQRRRRRGPSTSAHKTGSWLNFFVGTTCWRYH